MRIAYVSTDRGVPIFGTKGSSVHVQEVARAFRRAGHQVELFTTTPGGRPPTDLADLPVHSIAAFEGGRPEPSETALVESNQQLIASLIGGRRFDLVYERYALWSYAGMEAARALGVPGILEVNAPLIEEARRYRGAGGLAQAPGVAARAMNRATAVVAVSAAVAGYVRGQARDARVVVVPNGVDPSRFVDRPASPIDRYVVGFVGTMKPWHGLPVLAESFERLVEELPNAALLLVGDGPDRAGLASHFDARGLADRVEWTGAIPADQIPGLLARMDVAVAPYPAGDDCYFSPLKVFEYLAAGVAVVASRTGQLADLLTDRRTALLVEPGNAVALTNALLQLGRDRHLRERLALAGRQLARREFTWDRVVQRILRLPEQDLAPRTFTGVAY